MQNDSIQMRTAMQMFIDFLLENREEIEKAMKKAGTESATDLSEAVRQDVEAEIAPEEDANGY